jgi:hypothetical protein
VGAPYPAGKIIVGTVEPVTTPCALDRRGRLGA